MKKLTTGLSFPAGLAIALGAPLTGISHQEALGSADLGARTSATSHHQPRNRMLAPSGEAGPHGIDWCKILPRCQDH